MTPNDFFAEYPALGALIHLRRMDPAPVIDELWALFERLAKAETERRDHLALGHIRIEFFVTSLALDPGDVGRTVVTVARPRSATRPYAEPDAATITVSNAAAPPLGDVVAVTWAKP